VIFTFHPEARNELNQAVDYYENTRKCITNRFPFVVIYQVKKDEIFIAAIANLSRKPGYWKERLSQ
jgi:hypothetical protein